MDVLALVDAPDHVCCRYRILAYQPGLEAAGIHLTIAVLARDPMRRKQQLIDTHLFDTVILQRRLLSGWDLDRLRRHARRLVFDFDDAVFLRDSYHPRGQVSDRRQSRFARTVQAADFVMAGNDFLVSRAIHSGADPNRVIRVPTCVNPTHYSVGSHEPASGKTLVWIGSSSTLQGMRARQSLWDMLVSEIPGIRLRVICDQSPDLGNLPVDFRPWSIRSESNDLMSASVGISCLPDDLWSMGKCGLKIIQYQAAGLPVVADPVGVHPEMIRPGQTGFLPRTSEEWVEAIQQLSSSPETRRRFGLLARQDVEASYSSQAWELMVVNAISGRDTIGITESSDLDSEPVKIKLHYDSSPSTSVIEGRVA